MQVEAHAKPEELGEEDLVDYEEEEDTTPANKPAENGKDSTKKYDHSQLLSAFASRPSLAWPHPPICPAHPIHAPAPT